MNNLSFKECNLTSVEDLNKLLSGFSEIHTESWTKSVPSLYSEIKNGECIFGLEDGSLLRRVDVVCIKCFHTNYNGEKFQLIEEKQIFKNGNIRERGYKFVSEKLKLGELPEEGALRGLAEELQISGSDVQVTPMSEENKFEKKESLTYKGLACSYNTYYYSCEIFNAHYKESYVENQDDKQTIFTWIKK